MWQGLGIVWILSIVISAYWFQFLSIPSLDSKVVKKHVDLYDYLTYVLIICLQKYMYTFFPRGFNELAHAFLERF